MYRKTHQCVNPSEFVGIVYNNSFLNSEFQDEQDLFQDASFLGLSPSINVSDEQFKDFELINDLRFDPTNFSIEDMLLPIQSEKFLSNIFWEFDESLSHEMLSNTEITPANDYIPDISLGHNIPNLELNVSDNDSKSMDCLLNESHNSFNDSKSINDLLDNFCINTAPLYNNGSLIDNLPDGLECNSPIPYCRKISCTLDEDYQSLISSPNYKKPGRKPKPLNLTEDEKSILKKEGVVLPENVHTLTKTEERHIKQVKRRIKNKISAAESRKRKKDYVDGLEERVQQTTSLNCELQKRVSELEKRNFDLLSKVKKMKTFFSSYVPNLPKGNSALLLFIIAFSLFSIPSWISISNNLILSQSPSQKQMNFGSRTLLTQSFSNSQWLPYLRVTNHQFILHSLKTFSKILTDDGIFNFKPHISAEN